MRYRGLAGIELQGWLRAAAGRRGRPLPAGARRHRRRRAAGAAYVTTCRLAAWLEDRDLGFREAQARAAAGTEPARFTLVLGADLRPGLYKLRLWFACVRVGPGQRLAVEPLAKAPSDLNLHGLGAADLLHREE